jgi:hypothetical protein
MSSDIAVAERPRFALVDWPAIFGGAVIAAGTSVTLWAFGSGIGLSIASTSPTWRDSSPWLWLLSGLFLLFNALCSFGLGGYAAGRVRARSSYPTGTETEFRDGMHGLFVWGTAVLFTAVLALGTAATAVHATAPSGGAAGPATSVAGENTLASELDELFRSDRPTATDTGIAYDRSEAARILLKSGGRKGVSSDDADWLSAMVARRADIPRADASDRVSRVIDESKTELHSARAATVMQAFLVAVALLLGAAVSWFSAAEGGRERDGGTIPVWDWSFRPRRMP